MSFCSSNLCSNGRTAPSPVCLFLGLLTLWPLIAVFSPRLMALAPVIMGLIGLALYRIHTSTWPTLNKPLAVSMVSIIILSGLSHFWAVDPDFALERTGKIALILITGTIAVLTTLSWIQKTPENIDNPISVFSRVVPVVLIIAGSIVVFELLTHALIYRSLHPDLKLIPSPAVLNRGSIVFIFALLPALHLLRYSSYAHKTKLALLAALSAVMYAIIIRTDSQSVQLAFVVGIFFTFAFPYRFKTAWYGLLGFMLLGIWSAPWLASYLFTVLPEMGKDLYLYQMSYASDRLEIWDFISRRMFDHPFIGHGIEATRAIHDFDSARLYHADNHVLHPHNFIIQIWFEFGAVGIALLSALLIGIFETIRRVPVMQSRLYLPVTMACLSVATTGYGFWQSWWLGTLFITACFCILVGYVIKSRNI